MQRRGAAPEIRAAGGVVWRVRKSRVEVALVHRPRYDDWALPKGKLEDRETEIAAAMAEAERLRAAGEDSHGLARALIYLQRRNGYLSAVRDAVEHHLGFAATGREPQHLVVLGGRAVHVEQPVVGEVG